MSLRIREEIFRMNTVGVLDAIWRDRRHASRLEPTVALRAE